MSIDLSNQPHDGRPRHCFKCKAPFVPCATYRNARQCPGCRANPAKPQAHHATAKKPAAGHTHAWDSRSLAVMEAAYLRMAWGRRGGHSVTGDSE